MAPPEVHGSGDLLQVAIVPLLALIPFLAPTGVVGEGASRGVEIAIAVGAIVALVVAGRFLLNPMFR